MNIPVRMTPAMYRLVARSERAIVLNDRYELDRAVRKLRGLRFSIFGSADDPLVAAMTAAQVFLHRRGPGDLDRALNICGVRRQEVRDRPAVLAWVEGIRGDLHLARYRADGHSADLDWAAEAWRAALDNSGPDDRATRAAGLAWSLILRYGARQDPTDLAEATELCRAHPALGDSYLERLRATPPGGERPGVPIG